MSVRLQLLAVAGAAVCAFVTGSVHGQDAPPSNQPAQAAQQGRGQGQQRGTSAPAALQPDRRLPPETTTHHTLELPGRTLKFTATTGSIALSSGEGRLLAELHYVAYAVPGMDSAKRPVTFAFNGGPGSASAWLHLGGLGPWRLPMESQEPSPSAAPTLVANSETFLDFTDLVFLDPIGTGYSHIVPPPQAQAAPSSLPSQQAGGGGRQAGNRESGGTRYFWSVDGDA